MDALTKNFDETLNQFIKQVQTELDSKNASLRQYEEFFKQCEASFPTYSQFVSRVFEGIKTIPQPSEGDQAPRVIEVPVEVIKEVEVIRVVEKEVPVEVIRTVDREVPVETVRTVEVRVEVPVEKIVERVVEKIVEVPVEVVREVIKEVIREVEVVREVYVNAPADSEEEVTASSPRAPRERSSARAPRVATAKAKTKAVKNVLVVDDAEINRVLMGHYFKALPVKIEFSNSGSDAIQKCQSRKFDLILMDLQMKDMGGIETAQQIRSFEKETPIFAITNTEPTSDEEQQAIGAGCNRYFSKGISKETLQDQVSETLFGELLLGA